MFYSFQMELTNHLRKTKYNPPESTKSFFFFFFFFKKKKLGTKKIKS
jgi:hypothetical protein